MGTTSVIKSEPRVSVIIPNYNHSKYLSQRIESVLNQTYKDIDIIILDDCSTDDSRAVISEYARRDSRIRTVFNTENSGSTFRQWRKGLGLTTGKYVWIAESDDYADEYFLETLVSRLEADATVGLAYANSWYVYEDTGNIQQNPEFYESLDATLWTRDFVLDGRALVAKYMARLNIIPNASAVVLRRAVVEQVPLPDGSWKLVGDWLYWTSLMAVCRVAYVAEPLNYFRFHRNNVRSASYFNGASLLETLRLQKLLRQYDTPEATPRQRAIDDGTAFWLHSFINPAYKIPWSRHREIYRSFQALQPDFGRRLPVTVGRFLFRNKLGGLRQLLGDGILYPILDKFKKAGPASG